MEVVIVEGEEEFGASHRYQWGLCCVDVRERRALSKLGLLWG